MKRRKKSSRRSRRYLLIPVGILVIICILLSVNRRTKTAVGNLATSAASQLFVSGSSHLYNDYSKAAFVLENGRMIYTDTGSYSYSTGIDVSEHNGSVDWNKVKADGIDFVFLRIGYRGYGTEGTLQEDANFEENYKNARKAGLKIGVYFFSQAVNETEAKEEADFVLKKLDGRTLDLPVTYDVENITEDDARTDNVSGEQFTSNIQAFSLEIANAGYTPMLYVNLQWELFVLNMSSLENLPIWYSSYEATPSSTYRFDYWQYSNMGKVDGIDGDVDMNIALTPVNSVS